MFQASSKAKTYSLICSEVSLVVGDQLLCTALVAQGLFRSLFASILSNATCLRPIRGRLLRLWEVPAYGMVLTRWVIGRESSVLT